MRDEKNGSEGDNLKGDRENSRTVSCGDTGFCRFLKAKALEERMRAAIASETSLKKDWLRPEEDEAWQDL